MNVIKSVRRLVFVIISLFMISSSLSSCSNESKVDKSVNEGMKIYAFRNDRFLTNAIQQYNYLYPGKQITAVYFDNLDEYKKRLSGEVMAGEGPDIIYFNSYTIGSLYKLLENGAFHDLQPLIQSYSSFDSTEFNSKIFDCGLYKNKRYFIPVNYSVPMLVTTKEALQANNIHLNREKYTQKDFLQQVDTYISSASKGSGKYLFSDYMSFGSFALSSGIELIDFEKKQVNFNNPEFIDIIKNYIKLSGFFCMPEEKVKYKAQEFEMLKSNKVIFLNGTNRFRPVDIGVNISYLRTLLSQTPEIYPFPTFNGDKKYVASAEQCVAINRNSSDAQSAFNFIKIILSEKLQSDNYLSYLPVNSKALYSRLMKINEEKGLRFTMDGTDVILEPLPREFEENFKQIIDNITDCKFSDYELENNIYAPLASYLSGKSPIEKCIEEMEKKALLYLNE